MSDVVQQRLELVISHDTFYYFQLFSVCVYHYFEVGWAQLEKGDVTNFDAPIRIEQHFNTNLMTRDGLFGYYGSNVM